MKRLHAAPLLLATLLGLSKCKSKDPTPDPPKDLLSLLPPTTQTGAKTFGCLVNARPGPPPAAF